MNSSLKSAFLIAVSATAAAILTTLPTRAADESKDLQSRIDKLEKKVEKLQAKLQYMTVVKDPINGLSGPHVIFDGCNVHVRDGSGHTFNEAKATAGSPKALPAPQKLGNLIIGYNEEPSTSATDRGGSHNLVVGEGHNYPQVSCVVFGEENTVSGIGSTVTGGILNMATSDFTTVSAGRKNTASNVSSSVGGGSENLASGSFSCVSGGQSNEAAGQYSSVTGGGTNKAAAQYSSVTGGYENLADAASSTVSGGNLRGTTDEFDWVAGSLTEDN